MLDSLLSKAHNSKNTANGFSSLIVMFIHPYSECVTGLLWISYSLEPCFVCQGLDLPFSSFRSSTTAFFIFFCTHCSYYCHFQCWTISLLCYCTANFKYYSEYFGKLLVNYIPKYDTFYLLLKHYY